MYIDYGMLLIYFFVFAYAIMFVFFFERLLIALDKDKDVVSLKAWIKWIVYVAAFLYSLCWPLFIIPATIRVMRKNEK